MDSYTINQGYDQALNEFNLDGFDFNNFDFDNFDFDDDSHMQPPLANLPAYDPQLTQQDSQGILPNNVNGQMHSSGPAYSFPANQQPPATINPAALTLVDNQAAPYLGSQGSSSVAVNGSYQPARGTAMTYEQLTEPQASSAMAYPPPVAGPGALAVGPQATSPYFGLESDQAPLLTDSDIIQWAHQQTQANMAALLQNNSPSAPTIGQQPTGPVVSGGKEARTVAEAEQMQRDAAAYKKQFVTPLTKKLNPLKRKLKKAKEQATQQVGNLEKARAVARLQMEVDELDAECKKFGRRYRLDYKNANQNWVRAMKRAGLWVPQGQRKDSVQED